MKLDELEKQIEQNNQKIQKKEAQVKRIQAEIKELKSKNDQFKDDMLLQQIKAQVPDSELSNLILVSKLISESGLSTNEIKEMFQKGEDKK